MEIEAFRAREYWTREGARSPPRAAQEFEARLTVPGRQEARQVRHRRPRRPPNWRCRPSPSRDLDRRRGRGQARQPQPLRALHDLDPAAGGQPQVRHRRQPDMSPAQRLYEAGHITYMRTDGIDMAPEAVMAARDEIKRTLRRGLRARQPAHVQEQGQERAGSARMHPPDRHGRSPRQPARLEADQRKLYDLIWKRTIASQMEAARFERTTVDDRQRRRRRSACAPPARS